ncbi:hypothetical protein FB567DRAFT_624640 [Paraphoma chrysanthemicola]|uniref:Uncharacterized protein n=1 Tax=Paraphoma chrysanthemicola TaxID=798071 RepID=A0A8K0RIB0_9PLEO|nr:hypothetical protein FB567DRAFT_624640 [Paraphoma chrysanthemicola]
MAQSSRIRRASRAHSINSDSPYTPRPTPPLGPPPTRRGAANGTRAIRAGTIDNDHAHVDQPAQTIHIPPHYFLPPTVPTPFTGTLEASLDAILEFGTRVPRGYGVQAVLDTLSSEVDAGIDWPMLLRDLYIGGEGAGISRFLVEEFLFLVTRTLLPEQIAENRALMARLYERKKHLAIRLVLRYDMLREWKVDGKGHGVTIASLPPTGLQAPPTIPIIAPTAHVLQRRGLMPNVISTLIAAPDGGWTTHAVRERMKHHITGLDKYLVLADHVVAGWNDETVVGMAAQVVLQWQWLRRNNEILEEMEVGNWEELEGKADECEWIADDVKKGGTRKVVVDEGQ